VPATKEFWEERTNHGKGDSSEADKSSKPTEARSATTATKVTIRYNDGEESEDTHSDEGFAVLTRRVVPKKQSNRAEALAENNSRITPRASKNQALILNCRSGAMSYADMVREVKAAVEEENLTYYITTRRAEYKNIIL